MQKIAIIGNGGHARVVADILRAQIQAGLKAEFAGFIAQSQTTDSNGVIGRDEELGRLIQEGTITHVIMGIGTVKGGPSIRSKLQLEIAQAEVPFHTAIHPTAIIAPDVEIGNGTTIMAGVVINPGVKVGHHVIVNTRSVIEHDCVIGAHAHIAPGVVLSGGVAIGSRTIIGVGAVCKQQITIGSDATIGAGAVVISDVAPNVTVTGIPARQRNL